MIKRSQKKAPKEQPQSEEQGNELEEIREQLAAIEARLAIRPIDRIIGSNRSLFTSAIVAALILGTGAFLLIRGYQWRGALTDLRAEPGIQVMGVRPIGILRRQVVGLRDPLAPDPKSILLKHNIDPSRVDFQLSEYHSLNTTYGRKRARSEAREIEELRNTLIGVVGTLSEENRRQKENELGRISQILLEFRFPEEMKKLKLKYEEGVWYADGELLANEYEAFKTLAHKYVLNGTIDFDKIGNFTTAKTNALKIGIESHNLLDKDLDGNPAHVSRIARLIRDYDALCLKSGISPGKIELVLHTSEPDIYKPEVEKIAEILIDQAQLIESRVQIEPVVPITEKNARRLYLRIVN